MKKFKNSRLSPVSRKLQTLALKQLALGQYGYAVNALYSKQAVRDKLLQKVCSSISDKCKELCSTKSPSVLRDVSPLGLREFTETTHACS